MPVYHKIFAGKGTYDTYGFFQMASRVRLHLWGDSHLSDRHHVPDLLKKRLDGRHYVRYHRDVINHARSGQKLTEDYARQMVKYVREHDPEPMLHVLQVGSNDLWDSPTKDTVEQLRALTAELANVVTNTKSSALIITSPIPGDKASAKEVFEAIRKELGKEFGGDVENRKCTFTDCLGKFAKAGYDAKFWEDRRHLNREGASRFVSALMDEIRKLPIGIFGLRTGDKVRRSAKRRQEAIRRQEEDEREKDRTHRGGRDSSCPPRDAGPSRHHRDLRRHLDRRHQASSRRDLRNRLGPRSRPTATRTRPSPEPAERPSRPTYRYDTEGVPVRYPPAYPTYPPPPPMLPPPMLPSPMVPTPAPYYPPPQSYTRDLQHLLPPPMQPEPVGAWKQRLEAERNERRALEEEEAKAEYYRLKAENDARRKALAEQATAMEVEKAKD